MVLRDVKAAARNGNSAGAVKQETAEAPKELLLDRLDTRDDKTRPPLLDQHTDTGLHTLYIFPRI